MAVAQKNTFLTSLIVGDKVVEHHRSGLSYVSVVKSIDDETIVVTRTIGANKTEISYETGSGRIKYPYGTKVTDFWLVQYFPANAKSPFKASAPDPDSESTIPPYGDI